MSRSTSFLVLIGLLALAGASGSPVLGGADRPNVVLITIDTLRADHISAYGYDRQTSPQMDRLIERGIRFDDARTVEPLTSPALCSMVTSLYPNEHGSTRNGLRMREGLTSLPRLLAEHGYQTAAFVGNWTLRHKLSGLGEHFDHYEPVLTKKRWWGIMRSEATAEDLNERALAWVDGHREEKNADPFLLWVHYTEPHAPYVQRDEYLDQLGIQPKKDGKKLSAIDRYDTEIAYVDAVVGRLVADLEKRVPKKDLLLVLVADHGESLGEHKYWGHGRNLYEPNLRIPMAMVWEGKLAPRAIAAPSLIIDLAPTLAVLLGFEVPADFVGFDWTGTLNGDAEPFDRLTHYEAHKGAVITAHDSDLARRSGLLAVALMQRNQKEIYRVKGEQHWNFDLLEDPGELTSRSTVRADPTEALQNWMAAISRNLSELDEEIPEPLDEESIERLRALGYAD